MIKNIHIKGIFVSFNMIMVIVDCLVFLECNDNCLELREYATKLGIDVETEKHLLYIAREGLLAELPPGWKPW